WRHEILEILLYQVIDVVVLGDHKTLFPGIKTIHRAVYLQDHRAVAEWQRVHICLRECYRRSAVRCKREFSPVPPPSNVADKIELFSLLPELSFKHIVVITGHYERVVRRLDGFAQDARDGGQEAVQTSGLEVSGQHLMQVAR